MDKSCANHPESMALATCKACDKSVCLMCVVDEKEGTFCSSECHTAFANGQEVPKFVGVATEVAASGASGKKADSIFDDEAGAAPSASGSESLPAPSSEDPMPIVAEGTKWRPTGGQCDNHTDTPAVANCDRCGKSVCALCLLEAAQGTFCSAECMGSAAKQATAQPPAAERAALQGKPVFKFKEPPKTNKTGLVVALILLLIAGGAGGYYGWNAFTPDKSAPEIKNPDQGINTAVTSPEIIKTPTLPEIVQPPKDPEVVKPPTEVVKPPTNPEATYYPPTPRVKPPPRPVVIQTRSLNPWADEDPGTWYRIRTTKGGAVTFTDIGLKEKGKDFYVLATQTSSNGQASAVSESKTQVPTVYLRGEQSFEFEGQKYLCEIQAQGVEDSASKTWSLLSSKFLGAVLKSESSEGTLTANRVWEHTFRVNNMPFECLVVEGQIQSGAASRSVKTWYCGEVPLRVIRQEQQGESMVLVDHGTDWSKRPDFPAK